MHFEVSDVAESAQFGRAGCHQTFLIAQDLVQTRGSAVSQNRREDFKRSGIFRQHTWRMETHRDVGLLYRTTTPGITQSGLYGFGRGSISFNGSALHRSVEIDDVRKDLLAIYRADNDKHDVRRPIGLLIVTGKIIRRQRSQCIGRTERPTPDTVFAEAGLKEFLGD